VTVTHVSESPAVVREMVLVKVSLPDEMRSHLLRESEIFRARVVDSAPGSFTLEATGDSEKLEAFLGVIAAYGRLEVARTGTVAMPRGAARAASSRNGSPKVAAGGPILI
jgi:acetolactate synthase-1/3 small subunit